MNARSERLKALVAEREVEALLITFLPDIRWATGFSGSNGLVRPNGVRFYTDGRYSVQARREIQEGVEVFVPGYELATFMSSEKHLSGVERVGFQSDHATVAQLAEWEELFPGVEFVPMTGLFEALAGRKDDAEVARIRAAQAITEAVFDHMLGVIAPGMTEHDVAAEIVYQHLRRGASKMSFDPIVASGAQGALPHARPSSKKLEAGELVVLDFGCFLDGYASDMTRTIALGEPGDEAREVYDVVLRAQQAALDAARAGLTTRELDKTARDVIIAAGYGDYFAHGLGHGVGLQIHEWPRVSYHVDYALPAGATVTIEPGVYLPGKFGVRIEDIIVLREDGNDNLTGSPKSLIVV